MANKYLDYDGVQRLVTKLKTYISGKMDIPSGGITGQVLAKTESGFGWKDDVTLTVSVDDEVLSLSTGYTTIYQNADEVDY